ncbi:MAG TPA: adenylyltransferase/cytidyltransferase family protein, partial [Terriglobales bacterium]|nr:adenylyltransferase/cytidyltransferase family protein [Terriglobales bacterium]
MVFTNGVFDLVHPGHVIYLEEARALGASLFVGLNSDLSTRLLDKDLDRPINPEQDRATILAALQSVSFVAIFDERTPVELIRKMRPDIYVKGGDYDVEGLEETACVRSWGGRAQALPLLDGYSTT